MTKRKTPSVQPTQSEGSYHEWPEPQTLPNDLPPVKSFDFDLLPESLRDWIEDIAERMQCPPDYAAVAAIVALAGIVGRKVGIRPKRRDDWLVVPNLWGMVIGRPGLMKTPAITEPLNQLKRLEIEAKERFEHDEAEHAAAQMVEDAARKAAERSILAKMKDNDRTAAMEIARSMVADERATPVRKRYLLNDPTVEKLGEILNENPDGVLVFRDELVGLLKSLDKEGHEGARAFYLEAWNGTNRYTYDRIGRGTIDIDSATVSVLGGTQPGPLRGYQGEAIRGGLGDDGMLQRFQVSVWPDAPKQWRNVDEWPDTMARQTAYSVFTRLDALIAEDIGAEVDTDGPGGIPYLRFSEEAQEPFNHWREHLELRLRSDDEHPAMESHLAKYRSLIPSLALLIHLADEGRGPVGLDALRRAIAWGDYLETHARRIFAAAINPDMVAARSLARKITTGELPNEFSLRDIYRPGWTGLSREDAETATKLLADLDWLFPVERTTGGRPATTFIVNPRIRELYPRAPDKTDKSPSVGSVSSFPEPATNIAVVADISPDEDCEWSASLG